MYHSQTHIIMCTRQKYAQGNLCPKSPESTATQSPDTLTWPLLIAQAQTVGGDLIQSEVQLVHASLLHYRDCLAKDGSESVTAKANLDTVNELIRELQDLCFVALNDLSLYIADLNERR